MDLEPARRRASGVSPVADQHAVPERYDALADGLRAEWGELSVRVVLDEAGRRYELRHAEDIGAGPSTLERLEDPLDFRRPLKFDDDDRYRPLKTAPNAPTGWLVDDLDGRALVEAVEVAYPATVENWHRERDGDLDVTHWREAAERQTGIYGVIEELPREAVDWVAEAACVDSQCLKRREWEYGEDDDLAVDGGDGPFPCREPCSLVVAAARRWTTLEREEERTYEFTLTPSEKEQVEAVIDAVADDTADEMGRPTSTRARTGTARGISARSGSTTTGTSVGSRLSQTRTTTTEPRATGATARRRPDTRGRRGPRRRRAPAPGRPPQPRARSARLPSRR